MSLHRGPQRSRCVPSAQTIGRSSSRSTRARVHLSSPRSSGTPRRRPRSCRCSSTPSTPITRSITRARRSTSSSLAASPPDGSTSREKPTRSASSTSRCCPAYCNRGIGTTLLRGLQSEAAAAGKPLRIHVERFNPALSLYHRLGFRQMDDRGVYLFMEWGATVETGERRTGEPVNEMVPFRARRARR